MVFQTLNKNIFDYAGGSGGYMDLFCFPFARGRIFSNQEEDSGQYNDSRELDQFYIDQYLTDWSCPFFQAYFNKHQCKIIILKI